MTLWSLNSTVNTALTTVRPGAYAHFFHDPGAVRLTVFMLMFSVSAICLFSLPATTRSITSAFALGQLFQAVRNVGLERVWRGPRSGCRVPGHDSTGAAGLALARVFR